MTPLRALTDQLAADLKPKTAATIFFGREGFTRLVPSAARVQVLYDGASRDSFEPPGTARQGEATRWAAYEAVIVNIQGASSKTGATEDDHKGVVMGLRDLFLVALQARVAANKNALRTLTGSFVDPETLAGDDAGQTEVGARYVLHFQLGRGINEQAARQAAADLVVASKIIATRQMPSTVLVSGAAGSITATDGEIATVAGLAGVTDAMLGAILTIAGAASPANDGKFAIVAVVDATSVKVKNAAAIAPDGNNGSLAWSVLDAEIAA